MEAAAFVSRWLITIGVVCSDRWLGKLGLGGPSGGIAIERGYFISYFAIMTCLIASIILSFIFWLMNLTLIVARRGERFGHRLREA
jgi:Protein of unknown function (DUF2905)